MTKLYVAEFTGLAATAQSDSVPILTVPPTLEQAVAISTATSAGSNGFQPSTTFVEISSDVVCSIAFGTTLSTAIATVNNCRLNANERIIRRVAGPGFSNGAVSQVSVIGNT